MNEEAGGGNLKTSPRQNSQSVTTLQKTSIASRSPFSIRRVKPVKPDKLPPNTPTNNNNSHIERNTSNAASKKRSYFRRKSSSQGILGCVYVSLFTLLRFLISLDRLIVHLPISAVSVRSLNIALVIVHNFKIYTFP